MTDFPSLTISTACALSLGSLGFSEYAIEDSFPYQYTLSVSKLLRLYADRIPIPKETSEEQLIIVKLAKELLGAQKKLDSVTENSNEWQKLKKEIEKIDRKIDQEIYKLYGLTEEEIKIVEGR